MAGRARSPEAEQLLRKTRLPMVRDRQTAKNLTGRSTVLNADSLGPQRGASRSGRLLENTAIRETTGPIARTSCRNRQPSWFSNGTELATTHRMHTSQRLTVQPLLRAMGAQGSQTSCRTAFPGRHRFTVTYCCVNRPAGNGYPFPAKERSRNLILPKQNRWSTDFEKTMDSTDEDA